MIWAYYIELSRHMWADETAKKDYFYLPKGSVVLHIIIPSSGMGMNT